MTFVCVCVRFKVCCVVTLMNLNRINILRLDTQLTVHEDDFIFICGGLWWGIWSATVDYASSLLYM